MIRSRDLPNLVDKHFERLRVLYKAYNTEFKGNFIKITREAAEAWAKDYPDIYREYLDQAKLKK